MNININKTNVKKTPINKFAVGDIVTFRFGENKGVCYEVIEIRTRKTTNNEIIQYDLQECTGDGELNDIFESELELAPDTNKYFVPYHDYMLIFEDGESLEIDIADEDSWGDLQPCIPGDCEDWEDSIGFGNDSDGHKKIVRVIDMENNSEWIGNKAVSSWYENFVSCYSDNYSC